MNKKLSFAIICTLCLLSCFLFYSYMRVKSDYVDVLLIKELHAEDMEKISEASSPDDTTEAEDKIVMFYICGEVNRPDIYELPEGSRIIDAIEKAGGQTAEAALEMMESVAMEIKDGQKIYVPNASDDIDKINYMNDNISRTKSTSSKKDPDAIVNINTADKEELCLIPGIGDVTAELILEYRRDNGDFVVIDDIKNVQRIGEKTFESIKKNITVN